MMIASVLVRNEMLKMFKRLAFVVTFGFFTFAIAMNFGEDYFRAAGDPERTFALPDAWRSIVTGGSEVALIFGSVILILLLSSEFSWRTARQNVIDGLSKEQFFLGKSLLVPIVGTLFIAMQLAVGGGFALAGTDFAATTEPLIRAVHWSTIGGLFLAFLGYGSLALLVSLGVRNSGPAMAVWFFYVAVGEQMLRGALGRISERLGELARFLPINTFNQLHRYFQHDLAAYREAVLEAVANARRQPAAPWEMDTLLLAWFLWVALFFVGSFFWFRKRDL
jgi:ABC-type transport system involved in multi-copper enzyme maturation permease subunit